MKVCVICAGVMLLFAGAAQAQHALPAAEKSRIDSVINSIERGVSIGQAEVSPDGRLLAWVEGGRGGQQVRVAPMDHVEQSRRVTIAGATNCDEDEIAWAPDSHALAFFSDCASPGRQDDLYVAAVDGGQQHAARRITSLRGYVDAPAYSPDGKKIAFLYVEGATRPSGALAAEKPPSGVIGEDDVEVQRVAMVDTAAQQSETPVLYTPGTLHVFEFDWMPDSQGLAYVAADPPGENNWWVAKLYTQRAGGDPKAILAPAELAGPLHGMQIAAPRWSPDGKQIALIGGLMSDQGVTGGDVWLVPIDGGAPRNVAPELKATAVWVDWDGNRRLLVGEIAGGNSRLVRMDLGGDSAERSMTIFSVPGTVGNGRVDQRFSSSADRSVFAMVGSTFERAPEIYAFRPGQLKEAHELRDFMQLTHLNESVSAVQGKTVSINWKNEGFGVQGWLMLPQDYDPARKYPMIVEVHGGPASAELSRWSPGGALSPAVFSALGYFVLLPNPRGSFGQGEAFTQANRKDFGYGDLRDILAGVDTVLSKYPVDANRVGLTGWSYGGFMSMFAVTQTQRFKAAVAGAGISDWLSYYGENQIDQWMIPYFGASVYDDAQVYAKSSAISFIKQVKTPVLVVVGDRDGECPAPQSYEFWHGLRDLGVPSQLVVYPNEGHGFRDPAHSRDVMERAAAWFAEYMPASPS